MGRGFSQLPLLSSFVISGLGSHFGLALGTWVFRWAGLFLGPGEWACEPYFSNPINVQPLTIESDLFSVFLFIMTNEEINKKFLY